MKSLIKPSRLFPGDTIGIVSVSAPDPLTAPDWFDRGVAYLESLGYKIVIGKSVKQKYGYLSAKPDALADDINTFFAAREIKAIICAGGGINANRILPYIDYELMKANPKIFMGVSNPSVVLNAIFAKSNLITFHGPTLVWNFGNPNGLTRYTDKHLWTLLQGGDVEVEPTQNWKWWREGKAKGTLVGGNLISIQSLLGTDYAPDWKDCILFWEDIAKPIDRLDMMLTHFKNARVFDGIKGMVIGELVNCQEKEGDLSLDQVLNDLLSEYNFPVLTGVALGHTDDKVTLPIGATVELDSSSNKFNIIESPVS